MQSYTSNGVVFEIFNDSQDKNKAIQASSVATIFFCILYDLQEIFATQQSKCTSCKNYILFTKAMAINSKIIFCVRYLNIKINGGVKIKAIVDRNKHAIHWPKCNI